MTLNIAILTVSDRSYAGTREDLSGPALVDKVQKLGWTIKEYTVVSDDHELIVEKLIFWCDHDPVDIILTTGGTGFSSRDVTPEATRAVIDREAAGLAEAMRAESLKITPHAMLSRAVAGIRKKTLIINLPGSPKAAVENLSVVKSVLPHAVDLLRDNPDSERGHNIVNQEGE